MIDPLIQPWRVGRKLGRTVYAQVSSDPGDDDILLGMMDDVDLAKHVCAVHNALLKYDTLEIGDD